MYIKVKNIYLYYYFDILITKRQTKPTYIYWLLTGFYDLQILNIS